MSDISPIGNPNPAHNRISADVPAAGDPNPAVGVTRAPDTIEVSTHARLLSLLDQLPDVRQDLVDRVGSEIESGVYDEDHKLDAALDALIEQEL